MYNTSDEGESETETNTENKGKDSHFPQRLGALLALKLKYH